MAGSRTHNMIKSSTFGLIYQMIYSFMYFAVRTVFIYELGKTYLGLNGLFSDILTLLSLAELGFGTATVYFMYKPYAEQDERAVAALLTLYGKVYKVIGIAITVIGVALTPFLNFVISDMPDIPEIGVIYILYLLNTTLSYFWIYKKSILMVDQKMHISYAIQSLFITLQYIVQIIVLVVLKNYLLYLLIQVLCTVLSNMVISIYVERKYTFLKEYKKEKNSKEFD